MAMVARTGAAAPIVEAALAGGIMAAVRIVEAAAAVRIAEATAREAEPTARVVRPDPRVDFLEQDGRPELTARLPTATGTRLALAAASRVRRPQEDFITPPQPTATGTPSQPRAADSAAQAASVATDMATVTAGTAVAIGTVMGAAAGVAVGVGDLAGVSVGASVGVGDGLGQSAGGHQVPIGITHGVLPLIHPVLITSMDPRMPLLRRTMTRATRIITPTVRLTRLRQIPWPRTGPHLLLSLRRALA